MKNYLRNIIGAVSIATLAVACGDKGGGGQVVTTPTPGGVNVVCAGCPTATTLLASATGRSYAGDRNNWSAELSLQLYADSAVYTGAQNTGTGYFGNIVAGGVFRVRTPQYGCNLPAGEYPISTTSPGQINGQVFSDMALASTGGPMQLTLTLSQNSLWTAVPALVDAAGAQFPYSVATRATVTSMGGGSCTFFIFQ